MKKIFILLIALLLSTLLVIATTNDIDAELVNSLKECKNEKYELYPTCVTDYNQEKNQCRINNNDCKSNAIEYSDKIACKVEYIACLISINNEKRICRRNIITDYKECKRESREKKQVCMTLYEPVCGADDKTYPNECVLELAGVEQACDGECPCESNAALVGGPAEVVEPICGNAICEQNEANEITGGCGPDADPRCLGPPISFKPGTCPQDC